LLAKMPGDRWQRFANLRLLLAYMYTRPGKKLLFMGSELAPEREWNHDTSLDWHLADDPLHGAARRFVADLGAFYDGEPALWAADYDVSGFHWIDCHDAEQSVISYLRRAPGDPGRDVGGVQRVVVCVLNFTPVPRHGYRVGFPAVGRWRERLNSDAAVYGGAISGTRARSWRGRSATTASPPPRCSRCR